MNLEKLFNPERIAIIGASKKPGSVGFGLVNNLLVGNRKVFLVNPFESEIKGLKTFNKITDIKESVDLAIIAVPAKIVKQIVLECAQKKVSSVIVVASGFGETGEQGKKTEKEILDIVLRNNIALVGPNCLGLINVNKGINASFAPLTPGKGNIAFLSQSGAVIDAVIGKYKDLGFSKIVSYGNELNVSLNDLIDHLRTDKDTKVVALYLEGIKHGKKFMEIVRKANKPIVVLKAGKTEKGKSAVQTHTGSLAGDSLVYSAVFKQLGIKEAQSIEELMDMAKALAWQERCDNNIAVVTNGGGLGVLTADYCDNLGINLIELKSETMDKLEKIDNMVVKRNPLDVLGDALEDKYYIAVKALLEQEDISGLVVILSPQIMTNAEETAKILVDLDKQFKKTMVSCFIGGKLVESAVKILEENKIPNYNDPIRAIKTIKGLII